MSCWRRRSEDRLPEREAVQSDLPVYQAVAARRIQADVQLWQVPALSLTAQAFLLTIALGSDMSRVSRLLAAGLGVVAAFLSLHLFMRQRQAELVDAHWLADYEQEHFGATAHGRKWKEKRNAISIQGYPGSRLSPFGRLGSFYSASWTWQHSS